MVSDASKFLASVEVEVNVFNLQPQFASVLPELIEVNITAKDSSNKPFVYTSPIAKDPEGYKILFEVVPKLPAFVTFHNYSNFFEIQVNKSAVTRSQKIDLTIYVGDHMRGPREYPGTSMQLIINFGSNEFLNLTAQDETRIEHGSK